MPNISNILSDKSLKAKAKTETLSGLLLANEITIEQLLSTAALAKEADKATCIEALEFATRQNPAVATLQCLEFVTQNLQSKAPRVKWESAKVIGNIAALYPGKLDKAIHGLMINTEDAGTVVRWSAAFALGEILKLNTKHQKNLLAAVEAICMREEKNSIKKMYIKAIKDHSKNI
jgi:HEAT repeat protein